MTSHRERVERIAAQVRERAGRGGFTSLKKGAVSHFVPNPHDPRHDDKKVDIGSLNAILELDVANRRCVAEPGVTFSELVKRTLAHGLLPKLVPELETITIGGAVAGCSVESMSYRYGGFHDGCTAYEVVTGTGEVVNCSREHDAELFEMIHGSYGTLGILTQLEFGLVPAKRFVRMEYRLHRSFESFRADMEERCAAGDYDFVDGIIHAPDAHVLCLGRMVDSTPVPTSDYTRENIYYKATLAKREDYLTTYDYLFRYDTECHWLTRTLPLMERPLVRRAVGPWLLGSTNLLTWAKRLRPVMKHLRDPNVVVDVFIPSDRFADFWGWYARVVDFYPLWVVPYRVPKMYPWVADAHAAGMTSDLMIDCAVYGKRNDVPGVDFYKLLEDKTRELHGIKTLISKNSYDEETFWSIYNRANYDAVKRRTDPHNLFRGLYEKFHFGPGRKPASATAPQEPAAAPPPAPAADAPPPT